MNRQCGSCTLCCKLLPVNEGITINDHHIPGFHKEAGVRCMHQCSKGCRVYATPKMPHSCQLWNCRWIVNDDTADLSRPDRVHYVIDMAPDYVVLRDDNTGQQMNEEVIQVWVDPAFPDAHEDPGLRRYLDRQAKPALLRYNSTKASLLVPPSLTGEGWWLRETNNDAELPHSINEIAKRIGATIEHDFERQDGAMVPTTITMPDGRKVEVAVFPREKP